MPTVYDHLFVVAFALALPLVGLWRQSRRSQADEPTAHRRERLYVETIVMQVALVGIALTIWLTQGRRLILLGLAPGEGWAFWGSAAVIAAAAVVFCVQMLRLRQGGVNLNRAREQIERLEPILPHTFCELRCFLLLAVIIGVCEEILYRGYLLWWSLTLGAPVWAAVGLSAALFGLAHLQQGFDNAMRLFSLGLVFGAIYWLTGSIWLPIAAHVLIDVTGGLTAYLTLRSCAIRPVAAPACS